MRIACESRSYGRGRVLMAVRKRLRDCETSARICERRAGSAWMYKARGNADREIGKAWKAKQSRETRAPYRHRLKISETGQEYDARKSLPFDQDCRPSSGMDRVTSIFPRSQISCHELFLIKRNREHFRNGRLIAIIPAFRPTASPLSRTTTEINNVLPASRQAEHFEKKKNNSKHRGTVINVWPSRF